jgi:hypothetical protein
MAAVLIGPTTKTKTTNLLMVCVTAGEPEVRESA